MDTPTQHDPPKVEHAVDKPTRLRGNEALFVKLRNQLLASESTVSEYNAKTKKHTIRVTIELENDEPFQIGDPRLYQARYTGMGVTIFRQPDSFGFMTLPPELRVLVYKATFRNSHTCKRPGSGGPNIYYPDEGGPICFRCHAAIPYHLSLAKTCKLVYEEAMPVFYETNHFAFSQPARLTSFLRMLNPSYFQFLRRLTVCRTGSGTVEREAANLRLLVNAPHMELLEFRGSTPSKAFRGLGMPNLRDVEPFLKAMVATKKDNMAAINVFVFMTCRGGTTDGELVEELLVNCIQRMMKWILGEPYSYE